MRKCTEFNGKAMGRHINMPDIDRDYQRLAWSRCRMASERNERC